MNALQKYNKIVVTDLMHIGDLIFLSPFLHVLRRAYPSAEITILVDEKTQDVYVVRDGQKLTFEEAAVDAGQGES